MTNFEKYAGTPERFATFIVELETEGDVEILSRRYCRGGCIVGEDANCTKERWMKCVLDWLKDDHEN